MPLHCTEAFVAIAARDFDRLVQFYHIFLGQTPTQLRPNVYAEFHLPGLKLGIFRPKTAAEVESSSTSQGLSLCLEVADLDGAIAHLAAIGYPTVSNIVTASHGREIYAYDPDGNWLILHQQQYW